MIRYRLDDLGWYQFEWLVQAALKAELGLGVESWSSARGDYGRDAYFDGELVFPSTIPAHGPFMFQVKFVENANAKGSRPIPALLSAVRKEVARIKARCAGIQARWETPAHYALLSNTPLEADDRLTIKDTLAEALPDTTVTCLGASDVCDILDAHPTLRRSFPQLLSLRDLNIVLEEAVSHELLERSRAAVDASEDIVRTFVPTGAYERTWKVLRSHQFAVLYGPPEMGKTAIAWMIALAQLSQGWEAFLCQSPDDFFRVYEKSRRVCQEVRDAWNEREAMLDAQELTAFSSASLLIRPLPELPALGPSWTAATTSLATELSNAEDNYLDPSALNDWVDLADAISKCEPRFLAQTGFPKDYEDKIELWLKIAEEELKLDSSLDSPSDLREELARLLEVASGLEKLASLAPDYAGKATDLATRLERRARSLEKQAIDLEELEPVEDDEVRPSSTDLADVRLIFSDL